MPPKLLIVSNELLGLGHLRIALRVSASIQSGLPDSSILLLTGSPMLHAFPLPPGLDAVTLPGVTRSKERVTAYRSHRLPLAFSDVKKLRERITLATARTYRPDLLLVDYRPAGVGGELLSTLRVLKRQQQAPLVLLLRDILDDPRLVQARWRADRAMSALEELYDEIWVYGCQNLYDLVKEHQLPETVARKVRFCGYLDIEPPAASTEETRRALEVTAGPFVLVTIGNGRVGFPVLDTYLRALARLPENFDIFSLVVGGPELPLEERETIRRLCEASATPPRRRRVRFLDFSPRLVDYMGAADLIVSMGGYNTVLEILRLQKRAVVVPYVNSHKEQLIRAALLERLGLIRTIMPDHLTPERLAESVISALHDRPPTRQRLQELGFDFGGLQRIKEHVLRLIGHCPPVYRSHS